MLTTLSKIIKTKNLNEIFAILKESCGLKGAIIYEMNGEKPVIKNSFGEIKNTQQITEYELKIQDVRFGLLKLHGIEKSDFWQLVSEIIAERIKHQEFNQIMSQQIKALQEGILTQDNEKRLRNNFFASVTHELRTPLNSIIGYSELLTQGLGGTVTEKQKEYLLDIQTSGLNLLTMINDILDFSKINSEKNSLNISEFEFEQLFFEVNNTVAPLLRKKELTLEQNIQNFTLRADYRKTFQILINLLSNAIKYSRIGDKITILTLISDKYRVIEIKDNGIGIPPKSQKKIFKEFTQAKNNHSKENSTGLGLTIVKNFCDLHGWKIEVESEENQGATFRIVIS